MGTVRVMPGQAAGGALNPITNGLTGRTFSAAAGAYLDLPEFDAGFVCANGWVRVPTMLVGTTAERPTSSPGDGTKPERGALFLDTTIGKVIVYDRLTGSWRDAVTFGAV